MVWNVPPGCPDARSVEARARNLAGADAATWANTGSVRGRIASDAGGWVLSLEIERATADEPGRPSNSGSSSESSAESTEAYAAAGSPSGSFTPARVFRARDCGELVEAAAVAIALALGGADAEAPPPPEAPPVPSPPAPPAPEHDAPSGTGSSLASRLESIGAVARAEALVDTESLGGLALGAGAELGVQWAALGLRAYGVGLPSRQIQLAREQYVELSLWAAGLRGCYRASDGLPLIDVCAGGEVGAFGAAGRGLIDSKVRRDVWSATTWGAWFGLELTDHLQAGTRLEAVVPLSRERYFVNRGDLVHEMAGASLRLSLSLGGTLGSH